MIPEKCYWLTLLFRQQASRSQSKTLDKDCHIWTAQMNIEKFNQNKVSLFGVFT